MSNNRIVWNGLEELKREFRSMPETLAAEASNIVIAAANGAAADIKQAYPVRTGKLRDGMKVEERNRDRASVMVLVKNTARHAHLYEHGTQARHTDIGANRGVMPAGNTFIPRIIRARRRMYERLADLLERAGFQVKGSA